MSDRIKTVVVTGGTVRLGKSIADRLDEDGWRVVRTSHRLESESDLVVDLARPDGPRQLMEAVLKMNGGAAPDALVNNAAAFTGDGSVVDMLNFKAPRILTDLMAALGGKAVVNVLDCRVLKPVPSQPDDAYTQSKRRLLDETLASAVRHLGRLRVNAVAPGPVLAPVSVSEPAGVCPFGRPAPEQVAAAVSWLLSAHATTGLIVPVDGGQSLLG